jgi:isovaleryl-CoA dehydrogenase
MPDTLVVYAKTGEGSKGITTFIIEKGMPGFSIGRRSRRWACAARPTAELVFNECEGAGRECDGSRSTAASAC